MCLSVDLSIDHRLTRSIVFHILILTRITLKAFIPMRPVCLLRLQHLWRLLYVSMPGCPFPRAHAEDVSSILQASLSEQIRDMRKIINNNGPTPAPSVVAKEMTGEQRLVKLEETHQHILQMLDDLRRRVDQLEVNKQTMSGVRHERKRERSAVIFSMRDSQRFCQRRRVFSSYVVIEFDLNPVISRRSQRNRN